ARAAARGDRAPGPRIISGPRTCAQTNFLGDSGRESCAGGLVTDVKLRSNGPDSVARTRSEVGFIQRGRLYEIPLSSARRSSAAAIRVNPSRAASRPATSLQARAT